MKFSKLLKLVEDNCLPLPKAGTGPQGKILNRDLERVLADHFMTIKYPASDPANYPAIMRHKLEEVMLAYRYDSLKPFDQEELFRDNNDWVMEEKYDGCRALLCYHPEAGIHVFGRNRSVQDLLPVDYTDKVLFYEPTQETHYTGTDYKGAFNEAFIIDCEIITAGFVESADAFSSSTLSAVVQVLQLGKHESQIAQKTTAPLQFIAFDYIPCDAGSFIPMVDAPFYQRSLLLDTVCFDYTNNLPIERAKQFLKNKTMEYNTLLSLGKEGVVFKNMYAPYRPAISGHRDKAACVKCKRSMKQSNASDIDAYIIGYNLTEEYTSKGLIGSIKLGVRLRHADGTVEDDYWLATVSGMPMEIRNELTVTIDGEPALNPNYDRAVLVVDGMDISGRNRRITHARVDWKIGFRKDKTDADCYMDEAFMNSQMF